MKTAKLRMFTNDKQNYKGTKGKSFLSRNCIKVSCKQIDLIEDNALLPATIITIKIFREVKVEYISQQHV